MLERGRKGVGKEYEDGSNNGRKMVGKGYEKGRKW